MGWTTSDIPDQSGKVAVVTGANSGLGLEASRELARRGAVVIMGVRDLHKGKRALDEIKSETATAELELQELDLSSLDSVRSFASAVTDRHEAIDILINNAGIMAPPGRETIDGFESQVGTNHLGHFVLTDELMPALTRAPSARVVTLTSVARKGGRALTDEATRLSDSYDAWQAYSDSKLANFQFGIELARRLDAAGSSVSSLIAHPGMSKTNLTASTVQNAGAGRMGRLSHIIASILGMSAANGARPELRAATDPEASNGDFFGPRWTVIGAPVRLDVAKPSALSADTERMWSVSEGQTASRFTFEGAQ